MEHYFASTSEEVRHERSFIILLAPTGPDLLKQSNFTDDELSKIKNLAIEKLHRQRITKEYIAVSIKE